MCDLRRKLKKIRYEDKSNYKEINSKIKKKHEESKGRLG